MSAEFCFFVDSQLFVFCHSCLFTLVQRRNMLRRYWTSWTRRENCFGMSPASTCVSQTLCLSAATCAVRFSRQSQRVLACCWCRLLLPHWPRDAAQKQPVCDRTIGWSRCLFSCTSVRCLADCCPQWITMSVDVFMSYDEGSRNEFSSGGYCHVGEVRSQSIKNHMCDPNATWNSEGVSVGDPPFIKPTSNLTAHLKQL